MITVCNFFVHAKLRGRPSQEVFGMSKMDALDFTKQQLVDRLRVCKEGM